jgi:hypothetical protein
VLFNLQTLVERGLASGLVCDLTPHPGRTDKVAFDGSKKVLDLHRDFAVGPEKARHAFSPISALHLTSIPKLFRFPSY